MNKSCFLLAAGFTVLQELIYFQTGFAQPENVIEGNKSEFNGIVIEKNRSEASGSVIEGNKSEDTGVVIAKNNEDTTGVVIAKNTTSAGGGQNPSNLLLLNKLLLEKLQQRPVLVLVVDKSQERLVGLV